jgi:hypothetical protein
MKHAICFGYVVSASVLCGASFEAQAQQPPPLSPNMTFFVIGTGPGKGGDLGGLEGADRYCQELAPVCSDRHARSCCLRLRVADDFGRQ